MAEYWIDSYDDTSVTIAISPSTDTPYYRIFIKETDSGETVVDDKWVYIDYQDYREYTGLTPGTDYTVNVAYSATGSASDSTWIGSDTFTTTGSSGGGDSGSTGETYYVTLIFDANGGEGGPDYAGPFEGEAEDEIVVVIPDLEPTREGYIFDGWNTRADGSGKTYYPGQVSYSWYGSTDEDYEQTLYAVWLQDLTGIVRIGNGAGFDKASPYIWDGGWKKVVPYVWNGGWQKGT